jgi:hypothetical protein
MERITFTAKGHKNILGTQRNTLEFTKDKHLSLKGDCIIGVESDFTLERIKPMLSWNRAKMVIECTGKKEEIVGKINPSFKSEHEIVLRVTDFGSDRTLMTRCDKASVHLRRDFIDCLKDDSNIIHISVEKID